MLSDEEKEALRNFKSEYETCDHYSSDLIIELDDAEIILNLIEKQSKEIEEYKKQLDLDYVDMHFVPIERYNQLKKEIEELKAISEYREKTIPKTITGFKQLIEKGLKTITGFKQLIGKNDKKWKDKIKAKIEELDYNDISNFERRCKQEVLQSLLEKE